MTGGIGIHETKKDSSAISSVSERFDSSPDASNHLIANAIKHESLPLKPPFRSNVGARYDALNNLSLL